MRGMLMLFGGSLSSSKIEYLQRLQDRAVSMIHASRIKDNWTPNVLTVKHIIAFDLVYKIVNKLFTGNLWSNFHPRSLYSRCNTGFCRNIQIPKYNLEYAKKGFSYSALKIWNEINLSIRNFPSWATSKDN